MSCQKNRKESHKSQAIGYVGVCAITVGDTDVPVETNLGHQELRDEMRLTEPQLFKTETEFPEEYCGSCCEEGDGLHEKVRCI